MLCSTPSPLDKVTLRVSPTFALNVGLAIPSMPPPTPRKTILPSAIPVFRLYSMVLPESPFAEAFAFAFAQAASRNETAMSRPVSLNMFFIGYSFGYDCLIGHTRDFNHQLIQMDLIGFCHIP